LVLFPNRLEEYGRAITIEGKERLSMIKPAAMIVAAMAIAVPAHAQEARVDPEHIMTVLKNAGYPAEYFNDSDGDYRQILSKSGNYQFLVEMWDCVDGKECQILEFYANFPRAEKPTKEWIEAYPGPREGVRIWLDRRGDAVIRQELDINAPGGLSDEQIVAQLKTWETHLTGFATYLTQAPRATAAPATPVETADAG
jgi:hypothetical protein